MGGSAFKGSTKTQMPWAKEDREFAERTKGKIEGLGPAAARYGQPTEYETQAGDILSGYDPGAFYGGVQDYLGGGRGAIEQAMGMAGGPGLAGSEDLLGRTIGGEFLDVSSGPYAARNQAIADASQRYLNQNLDVLGAASQRASGGVGAGSAGVETKRRAVTQSGAQLGETLAGLSAQDLARERAIQSQAGELGMQMPLARAGALGGLGQGMGYLGSILGQAGTASGQLGMQQAAGLQGLGGSLAQRQLAGQLTPIDYLLNYLTTARGTATQMPSTFGQVASGIGSIGEGIGAMIPGRGWGG